MKIRANIDGYILREKHVKKKISDAEKLNFVLRIIACVAPVVGLWLWISSGAPIISP